MSLSVVAATLFGVPAAAQHDTLTIATHTQELSVAQLDSLITNNHIWGTQDIDRLEKKVVTFSDTTTNHISPLDRPWHRRLAFRTSIPYSISGTVNLGFEYPVSEKLSLGANLGWKSWPRFYAWERDEESITQKWKHLLVAPELRWYAGGVYEPGLFLAGDLIYTHFNAGGVKFPFGMYPKAETNRLQGDFYGIGASAGWNFWLGPRWRFEAEAGIGAGWASYDIFDCMYCGDYTGSDAHLALVPKLGLNMVYCLYDARETVITNRTLESYPVVRPSVVDMQTRPVQPRRSYGDRLAESIPWVSEAGNERSIDELVAAGGEGSLFVWFPLDSSVLDPDFPGVGSSLNRPRNREILDSICTVLGGLRESSDTLAKIQIVGQASIEGRWAHNRELGDKRAKALADYLTGTLGVDPKIVEYKGRGEAWQWFRTQMERIQKDGDPHFSKAEADKILNMMDEEPNPEAVEESLKADRELYGRLSKYILGDQRNSGYLRVYYKGTPDPAAPVFRQADSLMSEQRYADAARLIEGSPEGMERTQEDAEALNTYATARFCAVARETRFDKDEALKAMELVEKAARMGSSAAKGNLQSIDRFMADYDSYTEQLKELHEAFGRAEAESHTLKARKKSRK